MPSNIGRNTENVKHVHRGVLAIMKNKCITYRKMDGTGKHHVEQNKTSSQRKISHRFSHECNLEKMIKMARKSAGKWKENWEK